MFVVVYCGPGSNASNIIVYGPFTSQAAAAGFIAGQQTPAYFLVAQVFGPQPLNPPAQYTPQTVTANAIVVVLYTYDASGNPTVWIYGAFGTIAAAQGFIAGQAFPDGYSVRYVLMPPS